MRYINYFGMINGPNIGDYVIINGNFYFESLQYFVLNNIGKIVEFNTDLTSDGREFSVMYKNIPVEIQKFFDISEDYGIRKFGFSNIVDYSKNREDLELILNSIKFNI